MNQRTLVLALGGLALLLVGVIAGQNLERRRQPDGPVPPGADLLPAAPSSERPKGALGPALSSTQYWISAPETDTTRIAFASWAVLRPGGNFVLERCRAPDYAIPEDPGASLPDPFPRCETLVDAVIRQIAGDRLIVPFPDGSVRSIRFELIRDGAKERLRLDAGERLELVPGSKNDLVGRLQRLPGDQEARRRFLERMAGAMTGAAGPPSAARQPGSAQ